MKRLTLLLLCVLLTLCACGGNGDEVNSPSTAEGAVEFDPNGQELQEINRAIAAFNNSEQRSVTVRLSIVKGDTTHFFSDGSYSYTRANPIAMSGKTTRIIGGSAATLDVFYKAGAYYTSNNDGKYYAAMDKELFLRQYLCTQLPECAISTTVKGKTSQTISGTKYSLDYINGDFCAEIFKESLSLYSGLRLPAEGKSEYKNGTLSCVVGEDGGLKSYTLNCNVKMVDTAPYYPTGYQTPEEELTTELGLVYEVVVRSTGNSVEIEVPNTNEYVFLG